MRGDFFMNLQLYGIVKSSEQIFEIEEKEENVLNEQKEDIKVGMTLAGLGLAITFQISAFPGFIFFALPLAAISGYLVLKHIRL